MSSHTPHKVPFKGGTKAKVTVDTNLKGLKQLRETVRDLGADRVNIGVPAGKMAKERDAKGRVKSTSTPLAMVAAVHEFGSEELHIPERSYLRAGLRQAQPKLIRLSKIALAHVLVGMDTPAHALGLLGALAASSVREYIRAGNFTPLSPETIARKGSSKPLIDTAQLLNSITFQIVGGGHAAH